MSARVAGVAIETGVVRAVVRARQGMVAVEVPWDPTNPDVAVRQLRDQLGDVRALALSVGLGFLSMARPELPPLPGDSARRVLLRDADRYFPLEGTVAVASAGSGRWAFATTSEQLQAWVSAFSAWAPVRAVYAAPDAIAAGVQASAHASARTKLTFTIDADLDERGLVTIADGTLLEVRRLPEAMAAATMNGARPLADATLGVAEGRFAAAVGALHRVDAPFAGMLLDDALEAQLRRQRQGRVWRSVGFLAASLAVLVWSANAQRDRALRAVQERVAALEATAAPAYRAQARLARAGAELELLTNARSVSPDALGVLAIVSRALPPSAFVQRLEWDGREWRVDGSTDNASQVVPRLDAATPLTGVHALGASTRFRDGARFRESFSVAFTVKEAARESR